MNLILVSTYNSYEDGRNYGAHWFSETADVHNARGVSRKDSGIERFASATERDAYIAAQVAHFRQLGIAIRAEVKS